MFHEIPELDKKGLRDFGVITGVLFAVFFGLLLPWIFNYAFHWWPWIVCGVLILWAFVHPLSLNPVYRVWTRIGMMIGAVVTRVILGAVFFLVVTPIGIIMRALGKDLLSKKLDPEMTTYRVPADSIKTGSFDTPF
ncbi:MAG: sxtJ [Gammaproteobacteria bacterium]|nr:MAG: sxtJ [Gammaproteobacteria bacterium]